MPSPPPSTRRLALVVTLAVTFAVVVWLGDLAIRAILVAEPEEVPTPINQPRDRSALEELGLPAEIDRDDPRLHADQLLIAAKSAGRLCRLVHGEVSHCWPVSAGAEAGHKQVEGDRRTPEGWYLTSDKPESNYSGAISIHYPNQRDADRALASGAIDAPTHQAITQDLSDHLRPPQHTPLGGDILIHGKGEAWTLGCLSLTDDDLAALRATLPPTMATEILIVP